MSTRTSMTDMIAAVRQLIQDEAAPYALADQAIQDTLDRYGQRILRHPLDMAYADPTDGLYYWHAALTTHWENRDSALTIKDSNGTTLAISQADLVNGLWKLTTGVSERVTLYDGYVYDIYSATVECCRLLIARIKDEYTFSSDEGNFNRSQRVDTLTTLAAQYEQSRKIVMLRSTE